MKFTLLSPCVCSTFSYAHKENTIAFFGSINKTISPWQKHKTLCIGSAVLVSQPLLRPVMYAWPDSGHLTAAANPEPAVTQNTVSLCFWSINIKTRKGTYSNSSSACKNTTVNIIV